MGAFLLTILVLLVLGVIVAVAAKKRSAPRGAFDPANGSEPDVPADDGRPPARRSEPIDAS
jgi:hypothetical protein